MSSQVNFLFTLIIAMSNFFWSILHRLSAWFIFGFLRLTFWSKFYVLRRLSSFVLVEIKAAVDNRRWSSRDVTRESDSKSCTETGNSLSGFKKSWNL